MNRKTRKIAARLLEDALEEIMKKPIEELRAELAAKGIDCVRSINLVRRTLQRVSAKNRSNNLCERAENMRAELTRVTENMRAELERLRADMNELAKVWGPDPA